MYVYRETTYMKKKSRKAKLLEQFIANEIELTFQNKNLK